MKTDRIVEKLLGVSTRLCEFCHGSLFLMLGAELGLPDSRRRKNVFLEPKISMMENSMDLRVL